MKDLDQYWIRCKEATPQNKVRVMAKNPHYQSVSWIDGLNELNKPLWCHQGWEHADDFVTHWRPIHVNELNFDEWSKQSVIWVGGLKRFNAFVMECFSNGVFFWNSRGTYGNFRDEKGNFLHQIDSSSYIRGQNPNSILIDIESEKRLDEHLIKQLKMLIDLGSTAYMVTL